MPFVGFCANEAHMKSLYDYLYAETIRGYQREMDPDLYSPAFAELCVCRCQIQHKSRRTSMMRRERPRKKRERPSSPPKAS
eukprot:208102-Amphidinium_carterae.1